MKKVKKQVLKAVEVVARSTASEWPLFCAGISHQPKRIFPKGEPMGVQQYRQMRTKYV